MENSVVELNKKLSVQIPSEGEKKRRDEQFAAFDDYCRKVMSRNLAECFRIQKTESALQIVRFWIIF
ncbi:hypothetical protein [Escherichia coli]|uniref:hypothetical protein n=1 Tax=Escherichia coli TaxID=562 RepID=UPI00207BCEA5